MDLIVMHFESEEFVANSLKEEFEIDFSPLNLSANISKSLEGQNVHFDILKTQKHEMQTLKILENEILRLF